MVKLKIQIPIEYKELFNPKWRNIVYYGGRYSAKSHSVARSLLIRGEKDKLRILCTREIQKSIKDSVHKLLKDVITEYEMTNYVATADTIINTQTGTEFIFRGIRHNTNEIKSTEGVDICWIEEAHSVTAESLDVITPTIRKKGSQIIITFNRFTELDPVYVRYVMNKPPNTFAKQVNYDVLERLGWLTDVIKDEMEADRAFPIIYAHKWLGEPVGQAEMAIIGRELVLDAMNRDIKAEGGIEIGVDVARMGNDRTVFWKRKGLKTIDTKVMSKLRTTEVCDQLEQFAEFNKHILIKIDDTGVGGGVTDEMMKREYEVMPINFGGKAVDADKYTNWISEAWFHVAKNIREIELPFESELLMELTSRQWKQDNKGRRAVESKQDYKKRGFRSPDLADAFIICYYTADNLITIDDIAM